MYDRIFLDICPCCGSNAEFVERRRSSYVGDERIDYHVECLLCGLRTRRFENKVKAANAWNTRIKSHSKLQEKYNDNDKSYVG